MSHNDKKPSKSLSLPLKKIMALQHHAINFAKQHPLKIMSASLLAGATIAQLLRLRRSKGKDDEE